MSNDSTARPVLRSASGLRHLMVRAGHLGDGMWTSRCRVITVKVKGDVPTGRATCNECIRNDDKGTT